MDEEHGMSLLEDAGPLSVLERAKQRRRDRDLTGGWHDIPSWGGELKAYYQILGRDDVEEMIKRARARSIAKKGQKGNAAGQRAASEGGSDADIDFILKGHTNTKAVDSVTGEEQELGLTYRDIEGWKDHLRADVNKMDPVEDADEIANQQRLESIRSPRDMVAYLMGYNSIAIAAHAGRLANWMQDTSKMEDPQ